VLGRLWGEVCLPGTGGRKTEGGTPPSSRRVWPPFLGWMQHGCNMRPRASTLDQGTLLPAAAAAAAGWQKAIVWRAWPQLEQAAAAHVAWCTGATCGPELGTCAQGLRLQQQLLPMWHVATVWRAWPQGAGGSRLERVQHVAQS
jgi:hypothetical protein